MSLFSLIRAECEKLKHTGFWAMHIFIPLAGAIAFTFYFMIYDNIDDIKKLKLIMELTALAFPLLISIITGLNALREERASACYNILAVSMRKRVFLSKLMVLYGFGMLALMAQTAIFLLGSGLLKADKILIILTVKAVLAIAAGNLIIYIFHLYLSFRFGIGISLFFGIFENLQCIMYSNMRLEKQARLIPFSWAINLMQDIFEGRENMAEALMILILTAFALVLAVKWFEGWEGVAQRRINDL